MDLWKDLVLGLDMRMWRAHNYGREMLLVYTEMSPGMAIIGNTSKQCSWIELNAFSPGAWQSVRPACVCVGRCFLANCRMVYVLSVWWLH